MAQIREITYGVGGFKPAQGNKNIVSDRLVTIPDPPVDELAALKAKIATLEADVQTLKGKP